MQTSVSEIELALVKEGVMSVDIKSKAGQNSLYACHGTLFGLDGMHFRPVYEMHRIFLC